MKNKFHFIFPIIFEYFERLVSMTKKTSVSDPDRQITKFLASRRYDL